MITLRIFSSFFFQWFLFLAATGEFSDDVKCHGNEKYRDHRCGGRASHDRGAHGLSRHGTRTPGEDKRKHTEQEREGRHQDRPESQPGSLKGGVVKASSLFMSPLRELDDKDGIFGRETDEHDEADLCIDIVHLAAQPYGYEGAKDGDRRAEEHAERQRPAFVQSRKDEKDAEQRKPEDGCVGIPSCAFFSWKLMPM